MQERCVTVSGTRNKLPEPFFVLATQNPIEQEGTYPLPEAQLDRFMFMVNLDYPSIDDEISIVTSTTSSATAKAETVISADDLIEFQQLVRRKDYELQWPYIHILFGAQPATNNQKT